MATIVVLSHEFDPFFRFNFGPWSWRSSNYFLYLILGHLRRRGHRIEVLHGLPEPACQADLAILHVNATVVPPEYVAYARRYPRCLNIDATDISKRRVSGARLHAGSDWAGPVFVKSDRNVGGVPEWRMNRSACRRGRRLPFEDTAAYRSYTIFPSLRDVPDSLRADPRLTIEKFVPEREGDRFVARSWVFLGDRERCARNVSDQPIVKGANIVGAEPVEVPDELRALRRELGFDYGKFDFVMHEGRPVLLDANKTLGMPKHLARSVDAHAAMFADGLERLTSQGAGH